MKSLFDKLSSYIIGVSVFITMVVVYYYTGIFASNFIEDNTLIMFLSLVIEIIYIALVVRYFDLMKAKEN